MLLIGTPAMPLALYALTAGAFGIGVTEFIVIGLLPEVGANLGVSIPVVGLLISGYALGVAVGAPLVTVLTGRWPRKGVLLGLMVVFSLDNAACALAPSFGLLMAARVLTALAHGTFFGVGSVVAADLVAPDRKASAVATMFTGLTAATILGVPLGTWFGQLLGWRAPFWAIAVLGLMVVAIIALILPQAEEAPEAGDWRADLRAMLRLPVLLGLATTVLGYAGVFAVFTYVAPMLTTITGFAPDAVAPILLVFGGGLMVGNVVGGRLADRRLAPAVLGMLVALALVMATMTPALHARAAAVLSIGLLGAAGFSTVAPLQVWVIGNATGAGRSLASSFNIAAFNLGSALGAWAGALVIGHGPGLAAVPLVATAFPVLALATAALAFRLERGEPAPFPSTSCSPQR